MVSFFVLFRLSFGLLNDDEMALGLMFVGVGHLNFGAYSYKDASGYNLDNQFLVFKVKLPRSAEPS